MGRCVIEIIVISGTVRLSSMIWSRVAWYLCTTHTNQLFPSQPWYQSTRVQWASL